MDEFDRFAALYDLVPVPTHARRLRRALGGRGGTVVDLGGGTGKYTRRITSRRDRVLVVDASRGMLQRARRRRLEALQAVAERIPLADATADVVICTEAFHHFGAGQEAALDEVARLLRPHGVLLLEEPDPTRTLGKWMARAEHWHGMESAFHTPDGLRRMLEQRFHNVRAATGGWSTVVFVAEQPRAAPVPPQPL